MKSCPTCNNTYPTDYAHCPRDLTALVETGMWAEGNVVRGKYRILAHLGSGGMAAVYKAEHLHFHEMRALKVITQNLAEDKRFIQRFIQEAVITRRLQHPNAVRIDDMDVAEDGRPFIVMEYLDGATLGQVMAEQSPLAVARVCSISRQMAAALDAAHRLGIIHRDIKPANIVLAAVPEGEQVKVLDFGIAKIKEAHFGESKASLTETGLLIGTAAYMSPEQAMGKKGDDLDGRSDLYSLGVVMYQMLAGELPLKADSDVGLLMAHLNVPPAPISDLRPDIPKGFADLVMQCLEKKREARPADAKAVVDALAALHADAPPITAPLPAKAAAAASPYSVLDSSRETEVLEELRPILAPSAVTVRLNQPLEATPDPESLSEANPVAPGHERAYGTYLALAGILLAVVVIWMVIRKRAEVRTPSSEASASGVSAEAPAAAPSPAPLSSSTPALTAATSPADTGGPPPATRPAPGLTAHSTPPPHQRPVAKDSPSPQSHSSVTSSSTGSTAALTGSAAAPAPSVEPKNPYEQGQEAFRQKKYEDATRWYQRAADGGNARAMSALGNMYAEGQGVARDPQQAQQWYEKAAKAGDAGAMDKLGRAAELGQDYPQARQWYEKAVEGGDTDAMVDLGNLLEWGKGKGPKNYPKAKDLYEQAKAAGNSKALYHLGYLYEEGHGVPKDYTLARSLYEQAGNDDDALYRLGYLYERGQGAPKDHQRARQFYQQVAAHDSEVGRAALERLKKLDSK